MFQQLELTTTSLHNVVIANESDALYYEVVTPKWQPHLTVVKKLNPNTREFSTIAELQNEGDRRRPIAARVFGGQLKPVDDVMKRQEAATAGPTSSWQFTGKDGRTYRWQLKQKQLELFREGDESAASPVAVYHRHKRHLFVLRMSRRPYLDIDSSLMDTVDMVICEAISSAVLALFADILTVTFLLAERQRRDSRKHRQQ